MTHAEEILQAVAALQERGRDVFARVDVRDQLGLTAEAWDKGYTAIFQGMRSDHPGGAPAVGKRIRLFFGECHGESTC